MIFPKPNPGLSLLQGVTLKCIFFLIGCSLISACAIQKRKHLPGWHISSSSKVRSPEKTIKKVHSAIQKEKLHTSEIEKEGNRNQLKIPEPAKTSHGEHPLTFAKESTDIEWSEKSRPKAMAKRINSLKESKKEIAEDTEKKRGKSFLGGFLGALLALIALLPLVLIQLILSGDLNDDFEFIHSSEDGPFKKSFKRAFNNVLRVGSKVVLVAAALLLLIVLMAGIYAEFGLAGVIVALLCLALFFYLLFLLFDGFLDILFGPNR